MMHNIKGVIFDFNGVLWWDSDIVEKSWEEYSKKLRGYPLSREEYQTYVHGRPNSDTIEYLLKRKLTKEESVQMALDKESIYKKMCLDLGAEFKLSPGAITLLNYLVQKKTPHTIATASEISNVQFFFKHLKLNKWFDFEKVVFDDGTFPGKPAPDIFMIAAKKLGLHPSECMVIEDSRSGLTAATKAEIGEIVALGPKETHEKLKTYGKIAITIERLDELTELL